MTDKYWPNPYYLIVTTFAALISFLQSLPELGLTENEKKK